MPQYRDMSRGSGLTELIRLTGIAAVVALAALGLTGCGALGQVGAGAHNPPAKSYTVGGRVTTVIVRGGSGSIDVTGSSRGNVLVAQQATFTKTAPLTTHVVSGGTLTLSYTCPAELICGVSYQLQVPRGVTVQVSTGAGGVTLTSLSGPVTARAGAGLITAVDLRSPTASFTSNAGGVIATFSAVPASVHVVTDIGPITLTVPGTVAYRVDTHTLIGSSTITVRKNAASSHVISARSDLGSIAVNPS
jgi:hypothetical protein